jgi:regulator of sirC expression with transglutaminase-like and TPR domain
LIDAERVLELGNGNAADYLARASLYQRLDCPNAERFDLEHALLLSDDPIQRMRLTERLGHLPPNSVGARRAPAPTPVCRAGSPDAP